MAPKQGKTSVGIRRERRRSSRFRKPVEPQVMAAPPPPWELLSPGGVWFTVANEDALDRLADQQVPKVPRSNFRQLVGKNKNSSAGLPQHKAGWQLRQRVVWIERVAGKHGAAVEPQPLAGASGKEWVTSFSDVHRDPACCVSYWDMIV